MEHECAFKCADYFFIFWERQFFFNHKVGNVKFLFKVFNLLWVKIKIQLLLILLCSQWRFTFLLIVKRKCYVVDIRFSMVYHICKSKGGWTIDKCPLRTSVCSWSWAQIECIPCISMQNSNSLCQFFPNRRLATTLPGNQLSLCPSTFQLWHKSTFLMISLHYQSSLEFQSYLQWHPTYFFSHLQSYPSNLVISPHHVVSWSLFGAANFTWEIFGDSSLCCPFLYERWLGVTYISGRSRCLKLKSDFESAGLWETLKI